MLVYRKLFDILRSQGRRKYWLGKQIGHTIATKLERGEVVTSRTLEKVCSIMNCQPGDIMEYIPEKKED